MQVDELQYFSYIDQCSAMLNIAFERLGEIAEF